MSQLSICDQFILHSHTFCLPPFVERNENYHEIMKRIQFPPDICRGKNIMNHDYVFWCGDFNYRIDMANDQVKHLISKENWHLLAEGDQLILQVSSRVES